MGNCPLCSKKNIILTDVVISQNEPLVHTNTNTNNIRINLAEVTAYNSINRSSKKLGFSRPFVKIPSTKNKTLNNKNNKNSKNSLFVSAEKMITYDLAQSMRSSSMNLSNVYHYQYQPNGFSMMQINNTHLNNKRYYSLVNNDNDSSIVDKLIDSQNHIFEEEKGITKEEENQILMLKKHFLFRHFDDKMLKIILDNSIGYQIDEDCIIYNENEIGQSFFLIVNGKVEITSKNSNNKIILQNGDCFGEMALIYPEIVRNETVKSITKIEFIVIFGSFYREITKNFSKHSIEQITYFLKGNIWLDYINPVVKLNLASLIQVEEYEKNETIFTKKHLGEDLKKIYLVKSGVLEIINNNGRRAIYPKDYFGEKEVIMKINKSNEYDIIASDFTSVYIITQDMLISSIGNNYTEIILFSIFKNAILKNSFFKNILMECYYEDFFNLFKIKVYKNEELVYGETLKEEENKKAILILSGTLINKEDRMIVSNEGCLFGDEIIKSDEIMEDTYLAYDNIDDSILVLECKWKDFREKLQFLSKNSSLDFFKRANKLSKMYLFKHINENRILEICKLMQKQKYKKNSFIIKENTFVNFFYVISHGRVLVTKNGKFIRELDKGNCFGEISLLNEEKSDVSYKSKDEVQCYTLPKEKFLNFLSDENMNDFIKKKMCLEDTQVELNDLYHLAFLGRGRFGTVCLVHNCISLYAIKCIPKYFIDSDTKLSQYMLNEKKILLSLDYPLIVKLVKTLKTDNLCFFLMEYIQGGNLEDYIIGKKIYKNIKETKFFGGCMSLILDYLGKNSIVHRDIKPANILLNDHGYFKLTDFGTSKITKDFTYTVIGTPAFMAPEVIVGNGYSFPADYWSFGICMYVIYYGQYPFDNENKDIMEIYQNIIHNDIDFPKVDNNIDDLNIFISMLLSKKSTERLCTFQKIQNCSFYKDFDWKLLSSFQMKAPYIPKVNIQNEDGNLKNKRTLFLPLIQKYKFEKFSDVNEKKKIDFKYNILLNFKEWFDEF